MDATATGFIAAAASITNGEMDIALGDGGPHDHEQHIGLFIAGQCAACSTSAPQRVRSDSTLTDRTR